MIIWVNGTFGAGKSATSQLIADMSPALCLFDPETVGFMLRPHLVDYPVRDFQDWESWRILTPIVADEVVRFTRRSLVAPQAVLEEEYWDELALGLSRRGHDVFHVLLDADAETLGARIMADTELTAARTWRLDHLSRYSRARGWMAQRADLVVDTSDRTPEEVADVVWNASRELLI